MYNKGSNDAKLLVCLYSIGFTNNTTMRYGAADTDNASCLTHTQVTCSYGFNCVGLVQQKFLLTLHSTVNV